MKFPCAPKEKKRKCHVRLERGREIWYNIQHWQLLDWHKVFSIGSICVGWLGNIVKSCNYCAMDIMINMPPAMEQKDRKYLTLHGMTLEGLFLVSFTAERKRWQAAEGVGHER